MRRSFSIIKTRLKYLVLFAILGSLLYGQTGARYLVITPDYFYNTLQPLVEWKYKKGMKPAVYKLSQVGYDSVSIKNFILNCYNTWDIQPEYVILVGHPGYIPMCYYNYGGYYYYTDNYYGNMDGDLYNEILPGRLSVQDTTQLKTVINKVFAYERHPFTSDSLWFKKGCAIANCDGDDDSIYLYCMRYAESLAVNNGFNSVDTFCNYTAHNYTHILNSINQGRMFVMYRGNASVHWYDPFDINPYSTANGNKLPIILSTTCRTVSPNSGPILGENFLRVGTPTNLRGAVAFYGGTRNTGNAAHLRNAVAIGFLDAIFIDQKRTFGEAGEGGRKRVYQQWGDLREYNNFTCLGDPELNLWTDTPCSLDVQHPEFAPFAASNFVVTVKNANDQTLISNAFVCVAGKLDTTVYILDTTDVNGEAQFSIDPLILGDTLFVTVTGRNLLPYEGGMEIRILDYPYIVYLNSFVDDSVGGNNDARINPTEDIELPLWINNLSESTGVAITGKLTSNDSYITLTDTIKNFGDVLGNDSVFTGEDGYNFTVVHSCPNRHHINFDLICKDINDSTWVSSFAQMVYAPELLFDGVRVNGGNGNNIVDPGETLEVIVTLGNQGDAPADSVKAVLYSQEFDIDIIDSLGWFGHIGIDSLADNGFDPFVITVGPNTPIGTVINFIMPVFSDYCNDTFNFYLVVGKKNYFIWNPDPLPSSGENIHTILSSTGYSGDYGTNLPSDLNIYQTLFVCLGVYSSRYLITQGSAEAVAITDYLNNDGRVYLEGSSAWFVDPQYHNGHNFGPLFGINGITWSYGDLGPVIGQSNTFTNGMYFDYEGENRYMDHIDPTGSGFLILRDNNNNYNCGVANDAGSCRTVGVSFELGGLVDGSPPSTRGALLDSIMRFFGVPPPGVFENSQEPLNIVHFNISPNPFTKLTEIRFGTAHGAKGIEFLGIYDISGRLVRIFPINQCHLNESVNSVLWDGTDEHARPMPSGIYFIKLNTDKAQHIRKIILIK
ncbi:MAG: C25 family cysteine peptidase [bacterium]